MTDKETVRAARISAESITGAILNSDLQLRVYDPETTGRLVLPDGEGRPAITIYPGGRVELGPTLPPDEVSQVFWRAMARIVPGGRALALVYEALDRAYRHGMGNDAVDEEYDATQLLADIRAALTAPVDHRAPDLVGHPAHPFAEWRVPTAGVGADSRVVLTQIDSRGRYRAGGAPVLMIRAEKLPQSDVPALLAALAAAGDYQFPTSPTPKDPTP